MIRFAKSSGSCLLGLYEGTTSALPPQCDDGDCLNSTRGISFFVVLERASHARGYAGFRHLGLDSKRNEMAFSRVSLGDPRKKLVRIGRLQGRTHPPCLRFLPGKKRMREGERRQFASVRDFS